MNLDRYDTSVATGFGVGPLQPYVLCSLVAYCTIAQLPDEITTGALGECMCPQNAALECKLWTSAFVGHKMGTFF